MMTDFQSNQPPQKFWGRRASATVIKSIDMCGARDLSIIRNVPLSLSLAVLLRHIIINCKRMMKRKTRCLLLQDLFLISTHRMLLKP